MSSEQRLTRRQDQNARHAIGQSPLSFFGPDSGLHYLIPEHGYNDSEFQADLHPWYLSVEHALYDDGENVTVESQPGDSPLHRFVLTSFWATYVWPVFKCLSGH